MYCVEPNVYTPGSQCFGTSDHIGTHLLSQPLEDPAQKGPEFKAGQDCIATTTATVIAAFKPPQKQNHKKNKSNQRKTNP